MALQLNVSWCLICSSKAGKTIKQDKVISAKATVEDYASTEALKPKNEQLEKVKLGGSGLEVTKLGVGAWSWGDTSYWNNFQWDDRKLKAAKAAFDTSLDYGITFFDTAEVYPFMAQCFGWVQSIQKPFLDDLSKNGKRRIQEQRLLWLPSMLHCHGD